MDGREFFLGMGCRVVGCVSLSGGQGKTTTAFFLGLHLAGLGKRVLWVDCDPQANLTFYSGVALGGGGDLEKVYRGEDIQGNVYPLSWGNLFIIPAGENLARVNDYLAGSGNGGRLLERRLRPLRNYFDYLILDAPPSRSQIVLSVIGASTEILIPFEVGVKGTNCLMETLSLLGDLRDLELWDGAFLGALPFRDRWVGMNQLIDSRENLEAVRAFLGERIVLFPAIVESAQFRTAIRQGRTLTELGQPQLDTPFVAILQKLLGDSYASH